AGDRQLIADRLPIDIRDVTNLGHLPVTDIEVTRVIAVQHVDNELAMRENLLVPLNGDLAIAGGHVVLTEHELQRVRVTRLNQSQRKRGAKLGLNGAALRAAPCANLLSGPLGRLSDALIGHIPDGHIRSIEGAIKACGTLGPHGGGKHASGTGKIQPANGHMAGTGACNNTTSKKAWCCFRATKA